MRQKKTSLIRYMNSALYIRTQCIIKCHQSNLQVVLWDKIILRGENAILDFKNVNTKYYFWDDGNGLKYVTVITTT